MEDQVLRATPVPPHMTIRFPDHFIFGTSTSAYQIETAYEHDWMNVRSRDGNTFCRTTDHEKKHKDDIKLIASVAPHYRMSLMWSKLQRKANEPFDQTEVKSYQALLQGLMESGVTVMMVLHHFASPIWFSKAGGWENKQNIDAWINYASQIVKHFGDYVTYWNTFNEPNLYAAMAYVAGEFPPFRKNLLSANSVIRNLAKAHELTYDLIKEQHPEKPVGISHNCALFEPDNVLGYLPAKLLDWCYMNYAGGLFSKADFFGMSYYARIGLDPLPVTYISTPGKLRRRERPHDDMWEYYPEGIDECIMRFWERYKKPIFITENGICTNDDTKRIAAIKDYMKSISNSIAKGADVRAYYHWSTWDNFEWSLGPTFKFGLHSCDPATMDRKRKPSAEFYARLAFTRKLEINVDQ